MGFLDTVKEKTQEALEQGKDVVHTQQLKMQLRKLEGEEEEALAAFGNAAFTLWDKGSLSMSSDLGAPAQRIRDARAAIAAKKTEIASTGNGTPPAAEHQDEVTDTAESMPGGGAATQDTPAP